jgi:hypothetical protein
VSNPSKRKGTLFEVAVVEFLRENGFPHAERRALRGVNDAGDIAGVVGWTIEAKNHKAMDLGDWCKQAAAEAVNAGGSRWAVVHKRRQHSTAEAFVTIPLREFCDLLGDKFTGDR